MENIIEPQNSALQSPKPKTNYLAIILIFVLFVLFMVGAYYLGRQSIKPPTETIVVAPTPTLVAVLPKTTAVITQPTNQITNSDFNQYGNIIIKPNSSDPNKSDIYLKNYSTGAEKFFLTVNDRLYKEGNFYSYFYEYKLGYIYLYKEVQNTTELWKYDTSGNGTKLYANFSRFNVSNNSKFIAITTIKNGVIIIDNNGKVLKEYTGGQLVPSNDSNLSVEPFKWSPDDKLFFGKISLATQTHGLFKINIDDWSYKVFDTSKLPIGQIMDINQGGDKLVFDNVPFMFDVDTANAFEKSKKKVSLYIYNLDSNTSNIISTSIAKSFNPTWLNLNTVEYNDPNGSGRLTYTTN